MKYIPYGRQFIDSKDKKLILSSLSNDLITTGPFVEKFERDVKKYLNCKYSYTCSSGTAAIHLAMLSIGLKKDDKINTDFSNIDKKTLFYDLIYNPKETKFLKDARLRGNKTTNGQMMFLNQAKYAFNIWTNIMPEIDDEVIKLLD